MNVWRVALIAGLLALSVAGGRAQTPYEEPMDPGEVLAEEGLMPVMITAGDLLIENPWTRATPPGAPTAGGYLSVTNKGAVPETLTGAAAAIAARVEFHQMDVVGGVMTMAPLVGGLVIAPGETVRFAPGGLHLMLIGLGGAIADGDAVPVTLEFATAGPVEITLVATGLGGADPYSDGMGGSHEMDDMDGMGGE